MSRTLNSPYQLPYRSRGTVVDGQPPTVAMLTRGWTVALCYALLGYAVMGRGFAYLGLPPIFAAELLILTGVGCLLVCGRWWVIFRMPQMIALMVLCGWCALRTFPFIGQYGIDAFRDAILWAYSMIGVVLAAVIVCQPKLLVMIVDCYKRFYKIFLISVPFLWIGFQFLKDAMPHWPWASDIPIVYLKAGDLQVHLGGILGFWASEAAGVIALSWFLPLFLNAAMLGPVNRGGMMAFMASIAVSMIFKPFNRWAWGFIVVAVTGMMFLLVTGISFKIPGSDRPISADQLIENFVSVGTTKGNLEELQGTKQWRLDFWNAIIQDTVHGPYFWKGKGFGINLVSEYGFNIDAEETVRAPHNGHMTMLARTGVPGFVLWVIVHLTWVAGMIDGYIRSRAAKRRTWAGLFMWLLIYWLMIVINCSFDPYIEGPMGGVWLWSIYGAGIGAMWVRGSQPDLFEPDEPEADEDDALTEMAVS